MRYAFIGDIHEGYSRKSFTSATAKGRYEQFITSQSIKAGDIQSDYKFQVGDVFDKFRSSDQSLLNGITFCSSMDIVVVGNHDISNTLNEDSTMSMCRDVCNNSHLVLTSFVFPRKEGEASIATRSTLEGPTIVTVPYCYTQEQFELSIQAAYDAGSKAKDKGFKTILMMHTNYNLNYELTETTNNLTSDDATTLLEVFDYIVSGHEHNYSTYFKGRLIMTGSVVPVSTSELEDKYVHIYDTETEKFTKEVIWEAKDRYKVFDVGSLPDELGPWVQFVTITGRATTAQVVECQKTVAKWWANSKSLLVCKPEYEVIRKDKEDVAAVKTDMVSHIRSKLKPTAQKLLDVMVKEINDE